jgi:hypothetical protein
MLKNSFILPYLPSLFLEVHTIEHLSVVANLMQIDLGAQVEAV